MGKSEKMKRKRRHRSPSESDSSVEDKDEPVRKRHRKSSHKNSAKEKHTKNVLSDSSTDSSSSSSSSTSDSEYEKRKHHKKRTKKDKKSKHKKKSRKKEKKHKKSKKKRKSTELCSPLHVAVPEIKLPLNTSSSETATAKKTHAAGSGRMLKPLTKEEWEKQQAVLHRVYDPETGRNRLVRGDGEIVEEIVSKERHREINKQATSGDGIFYQMKAGLHK